VPSVAVVDCGVGLVHWGECLRMAAGRCSCSSLMVENGGNPRLGVPRKKYGAVVQLAVGFQLVSVDGVQMQRWASLRPQPRLKNCPSYALSDSKQSLPAQAKTQAIERREKQ